MAKPEQPQEAEQFHIQPATRHAVPQMMAVSGVTFSGKTYGALMLAGGLVEPGGKVGMIDTEGGRGSMYADDPDVRRVLPQGYVVIELYPPFHPKRYIGAMNALQEAGCKLVITDSGSHAWEGDGGCRDIKEQDGGWANAKLWNRRYIFALTYSPVHQIVCLRAQDKTKIIAVAGTSASGKQKQEYVSLGILPICEKSFTFALGLSFAVEGEIDGRPATHLARPTKWPKAMNGIFNDWKPQLLTPDVGRRIREWNNSAAAETALAQLQKQARLAATAGTVGYQQFFAALNAGQKKALIETTHAANKTAAEQVDALAGAAAGHDGEQSGPPPPDDKLLDAITVFRDSATEAGWTEAAITAAIHEANAISDLPAAAAAALLEAASNLAMSGVPGR